MTDRRFVASVLIVVLAGSLLSLLAESAGLCLGDGEEGCIVGADDAGLPWAAVLLSQLFLFRAIGYLAGAYYLFGGKRPAMIDLVTSLGLLSAAAAFGEILIESAYFRLIGEGEAFGDYGYFTYFLSFAIVFTLWAAMNAAACALGGTAAYLLCKKDA